MLSRNAQLDGAKDLTFMVDVETRHAFRIKDDVGGIIVTARAESECDGIRQTLDDAAYKRIRIIGDYGTVFRHQTGEPVKRPGDVFDILEIVKMVRIDVENDFNCWIQFQKTVSVFAGFRNKIVLPTYIAVAADLIQVAADQDRWLFLIVLKDQRYHGCGRGFTVGAGNGNAVFVFAHEKTKSLGSGQCRDTKLSGSCQFRIIITDSDGVNDQVCVFYVLGSVTEVDLGAHVQKLFRDLAFPHV